MLWPPPLIDSSSSVVAREVDGAHDVVPVAGRTTTAGRLAIIPFQMSVASANPASSG